VNDPASTSNSIYFTGRRQDPGSGLVYMGARYYDAAVGRFISRDPTGFDGATIHRHNSYAYANNNPYEFVDPDGKDPVRAVALAAYPLGVGADALSQYLAFGSVDFNMAATSNSAQAGALISGLALASIGVGAIARIGSTKGLPGSKTIDDLIGESTPGRETKGRAELHENPNGRDQGARDFESLGVNEQKIRPSGTTTGKLPDGRPVNMHDSKTDGVRTIETSNGKRAIKIRYPDK